MQAAVWQRRSRVANCAILSCWRSHAAECRQARFWHENYSADLDVILSRKLRAPGQPELAIGAVAEQGGMYLNHYGQAYREPLMSYLEGERRHQVAEIERRQKLFRGSTPPTSVQGRSVIVTDDGIATGSTMIAALQSLKLEGPHEVIVAVPVASSDRLEEVRRWCDDVVCLQQPEEFRAVGQFYEDFSQVNDQEVARILGEFRPGHQTK